MQQNTSLLIVYNFIPYNVFWFVLLQILECGGNLCDAVSLAVKAALFNTRLPFVKAALMDGGNVDLQLSDDPYDTKQLDIGGAPLLVWNLCFFFKPFAMCLYKIVIADIFIYHYLMLKYNLIVFVKIFACT